MTASDEELRQALDEHSDMLRKLPNVVGTGIGLREVDGKSRGTPAVIVYVRKKVVGRSKLTRAQIIPRQLEIQTDQGPKRVPVDVQEVGDVGVQ